MRRSFYRIMGFENDLYRTDIKEAREVAQQNADRLGEPVYIDKVTRSALINEDDFVLALLNQKAVWNEVPIWANTEALEFVNPSGSLKGHFVRVGDGEES